MLDIFRGLKSLVKLSHIQIDSPVFRLHYSITVMVLVCIFVKKCKTFLAMILNKFIVICNVKKLLSIEIKLS